MSFFTDHKILSKNEKYKIHINNRKSETFTLKQMNEVVNINPQCLIKKNNNNHVKVMILKHSSENKPLNLMSLKNSR